MLLTVALLWGVAVVTPGPNLVAVLTAARHSRQAALLTVAGISVGTTGWGLAGSLGLQTLFLAAPLLYVVLKLVGGAYLVWMGARLLWAATRGGDAADAPVRRGSPLLAGLMTNLSNPRTVLLVSGLFAATAPGGAPLAFGVAATAVMVAVSVLWYGLVGCLASTGVVARALHRARRWIDAAAGVAFAGFGARLVWSAR